MGAGNFNSRAPGPEIFEAGDAAQTRHQIDSQSRNIFPAAAEMDCVPPQ
jgi:hypothetical protein